MTRSAAISAAVADELAAHQAVLDAADGPHAIVLVVKLGTDGLPFSVDFKSEWQRRITRTRQSRA